MEAKLIIVGGKANKTHVSLKLPTIVGRSREAGLTIAHPMVSRQHCELFEENGLLMVRDLGSLNGTFVGKERITKPVPLRPNDQFSVGPLTFRTEYEYLGDIATPPAPKKAPQVGEVADELPPGLADADEPSPEPPVFPEAAAGGEAASDFALGPAAAQRGGPGSLQDPPAAVQTSRDPLPTVDLSPAGQPKPSGNNAPQVLDAPTPAAPAAANGQKAHSPAAPAEEDLDEFFKGVL